MSSFTPDSRESESHGSFFDAISEKPMIFVSALLAIVLIAAVVIAVRSQNASRNRAGGNALYQAQKVLDDETKSLIAAQPKPAETQAGKNKAPAQPHVQFKKLDVDATFPKAVEKFKSVAKDYGNTRAGFEAELSLGSLYMNHGQPDKAMTWFQQASGNAGSKIDQIEALSSLGYAYEGMGKYADAIQSHQKAVSTADQSVPESLKIDAMMGVARNQALSGASDQAQATYEQIIKQFPNSEQAHEAQFLKTHAGK